MSAICQTAGVTGVRGEEARRDMAVHDTLLVQGPCSDIRTRSEDTGVDETAHSSVALSGIHYPSHHSKLESRRGQSHNPAMSAMSSLESSSNQEKKIYDETQAVVGSAHADPETQAKVEQVYDPSQESIWTRLGLNFESYKRAPGSTR
jgi:hypothetical protein